MSDGAANGRDAEHEAARAALARARTIVVKIGSKSLDGDAWQRLADDVAGALGRRAHAGARASEEDRRRPSTPAPPKRSARGRRVVIVSSGAIALGFAKLGLTGRPKDMKWLQASAAAGQSLLMQRYEETFGRLGMPVAQVLLTHADLADRTRANNAREALGALLEAGAIPIINENDAVAVDEIRFGDNDQLAAMVTPIVGADLLVLLSDVDGLLDADRRRVPFVRSIAREARPLAGASTSGVGSGGMASKVEAARRATLAGAHVVIASAREPSVLGRVLSGEPLGTLFPAVVQRLNARKHWIAYTLRPRGALLLDAGAAAAMCAGKKSVLGVGVLGVRGTFAPGDAVSLLGADGVELARGLSRMSAVDAARLAGRRSDLGDDVVVHRDDLVVLPVD